MGSHQATKPLDAVRSGGGYGKSVALPLARCVAIYVSSLVRLRLMVNPEWARPAQNFDNSTRMSFEGVGELEDLHRIETVAATLGLFIADLIANAFGGS